MYGVRQMDRSGVRRRSKDIRFLERYGQPGLRLDPDEEFKVASLNTRDNVRNLADSISGLDDTIGELMQLRYECWLRTRKI